MKNSFALIALAGSMVLLPTLGCGASSAQDQRQALTYQQKSDDAAKEGEFGRAGDAQRKAQDAHASAVRKAIDEGKPLPPQPQIGDTPPPLPPATPVHANP